MAIVDEKIRCPECSQWKELEHFTAADRKEGSGYCRSCRRDRNKRWVARNRAHDRARRRESYAAKKSPEERVRLLQRKELLADQRRRGRKATNVRYRLKSRYSISEAEYHQLVAAQGGRCAICGVSENLDGRLWCVDHDHNTGAIRGLLCTRCNAGIGALGDTAEGVRRALNYLERAEQPPMRAAPAIRINLLNGAN